MDKKALYAKTEKTMNQAFQVAKQSVVEISRALGETAHLTRLLIEKKTVEHQVAKQFARLGSCVYERATREGKDIPANDKALKELIEATKALDVKLAQLDAAIHLERQNTKVKAGS